MAQAVRMSCRKRPVSYTHLAEIQSSVYPIRYGVVPYEDGYEKALEAMKVAGYDKVVEEYRTQFEAWRKQNNK